MSLWPGSGISRLRLLASAFVKTSARQIGSSKRTENRRPKKNRSMGHADKIADFGVRNWEPARRVGVRRTIANSKKPPPMEYANLTLRL